MELWLYSWLLWQRRGGTLAIFMALVPEKGGTLAILMALVPEKGGTLAIFMALVPEKGWYSGYIHGSVFHCKKKKSYTQNGLPQSVVRPIPPPTFTTV